MVTIGAERQLLTAGHCGDVGDEWFHGPSGIYFAEQFGFMEAQQEAGRVDAARITVGNTFTAQALIYRQHDTKNWGVWSKGNWSSLVYGDNICKSGAVTGRTCGQMYSKYVSINYIPNSNRFVGVNMCSIEGDSGSGVY
ncbi:MAG: S1 family peptidase, partial [Actinomycetota bacterium]|nr:S1 family peptidase [Actinomycetota bacterium]